MTIPCTDVLIVTRSGDSVQVELPTGDQLILSPESARDAAYWMNEIANRIQMEKAEQRKDARQAETGRART